MKTNQFLNKLIDGHIEVGLKIKNSHHLNLQFNKLCNLSLKTLKNKKKIIFFGNGGSAADAQHLATELVVKFEKKRKALAAISLSTDTSVLTAIGNDFGFENIFSRQLEAISSKGDLVIPISTSGNSLNIIKAINWCNQKKIRVFPFLGKNGGKVKKLVSDFIVVPSNKTSFIQEYHIFIGQSLCFYLDKKFN